MKKKKAIVREPIQVYMAADERRLLDRLAADTGLSRAEVLRQGLRSFAAQHAGDDGPMQSLMRSLQKHAMPEGIARDHDDHLAASYRDRHER